MYRLFQKHKDAREIGTDTLELFNLLQLVHSVKTEVCCKAVCGKKADKRCEGAITSSELYSNTKELWKVYRDFSGEVLYAKLYDTASHFLCWKHRTDDNVRKLINAWFLVCEQLREIRRPGNQDNQVSVAGQANVIQPVNNDPSVYLRRLFTQITGNQQGEIQTFEGEPLTVQGISKIVDGTSFFDLSPEEQQAVGNAAIRAGAYLNDQDQDQIKKEPEIS